MTSRSELYRNAWLKSSCRIIKPLACPSIFKLEKRIKTFIQDPRVSQLEMNMKLYTSESSSIEPHLDMSKWTFIIYLDSDKMYNGETYFPKLNEQGISIAPIPGTMLWFRNTIRDDIHVPGSMSDLDMRLLYGARPIKYGRKLILHIQY